MEKKKLGAMIKEIGKSEGKESLKTKAQKKKKKLKNSGKPKGHAINSIDQHVPRGHDTCGAATMHLIRSETPRVMDSSGKPFIFYGHHDNHRTWGATDGIDEITTPR